MNRSVVKAWLQLLRVSNYPTVVSNALTGCAIGAIGVIAGSGGARGVERVSDALRAVGEAGEAGAAFPWGRFGIAAGALVLMYAAGMALNDAMDAGTDRAERPHRPIPSGAVKRSHAFVLGAACMIGSLGLLVLAGMPAVMCGAVLGVTVLAYNALHKVHAATVLLMAACRGLAVVTAAACVAWPLEWKIAGPIAGVLFAYTVAISVIARREADDRRRIRIVVLMICAISLLDAGFLAWLGRWPAMGIALGCFVVALRAQRRVLGT